MNTLSGIFGCGIDNGMVLVPIWYGMVWYWYWYWYGIGMHIIANAYHCGMQWY
jgi:hypothetical protein